MRKWIMCLVLILVGCTTQFHKDEPLENESVVETKQWQYRIELVKVDKFMRYGLATFKVEKRLIIKNTNNNVWEKVADAPVQLLHVGDELVLSDVSDVTDENGEFNAKVELVDPLKFFRWVNKESYGINLDYLNNFDDVVTTKPIIEDLEWQGWTERALDMSFVAKFEVADVTYWLPIPYKNIRPELDRLAKQIHHDVMLDVQLVLMHQNTIVPSGDVELIGESPKPMELLKPYFSEPTLLAYVVSVFPNYHQKVSAGYDLKKVSVYPGTYQVKLDTGRGRLVSKSLKIECSGLLQVDVF